MFCTNETGAESTRTRQLKECVENANVVPVPTVCCPVLPSVAQVATTTSESDYLLASVTACPLYFRNLSVAGSCSPATTATLSLPGTYVAPRPTDIVHVRSFPRISGIDKIAHVVRGVSSSELTARRRNNLLNSSTNATAPTTALSKSQKPFFRTFVQTPCAPRIPGPLNVGRTKPCIVNGRVVG